MNIGIIGSGGREHALCKKISTSKISKNELLMSIFTVLRLRFEENPKL